MIPLICFALSFLAPISTLKDTTVVTLFGEKHLFPRSLYEQIVPANPMDAETISTLSTDIPSLYEGKFAQSHLSFRPTHTYELLLKGTDMLAQAEGEKDLFFVYRDEDQDVLAYVHGRLSKKKNKATIDELVVEPSLRRRGVATVLLAKLLEAFSQSGKTDVEIISRIPLPDNLVKPFKIKFKQTKFDVRFIVHHILSRFSLNYIMYQNSKKPPLYKAVALEMRDIVRQAKEKDQFSTKVAVGYLKSLADSMEDIIDQKIEEEGEGKLFYFGIQDDELALANVYFALYILSLFSLEEPELYNERGAYFSDTLFHLQEGQAQGGHLPVDYQIFIARVFAFGRFLAGEEKYTLADLEWVEKSAKAYLLAIDLGRRGGQTIYVSHGHVQKVIQEILWFRYSYKEARIMAKEMMGFRQRANRVFKLKRSLVERERMAIAIYKEFQQFLKKEKGIDLKDEFGLLFLYTLPLYAEENLEFHYKLGDLFALSSFYMDALGNNLLEEIESKVSLVYEPGHKHGRTLILSDQERESVSRILKRLFEIEEGPPSLIDQKEVLATSL